MEYKLYSLLKEKEFAEVVKIALKERFNPSFDSVLTRAISNFDTLGIMYAVVDYGPFLDAQDNVFDWDDEDYLTYKCESIVERNFMAAAIKIKVIEMLMVKFEEEQQKIAKLAGM